MSNKMISVFLREQRHYTQQELVTLFQCSEEFCVRILKRLKEYGILKTTNGTEKDQEDLCDLIENDIEITNIEVGENKLLYVFTFVGVMMIEGRVLKCYPKYITNNNNPIEELKQVLKVLQEFNKKNQIIRIYNETDDNSTFNMIAVMLYLLEDYFEYGVYTNINDIIELNGTGEILWDKTINETYTLLCRNRPYYPELLTKKHKTDDYDFFKRLHESILTRCSKELEIADLSYLFDLGIVDLTDETLDDFGDKEYILDRLEKEINIQFNTRKQMLLKTMYAYIANSGTIDDSECFSMFGTNSFYNVWEKVCGEVLDNKLNTPIGALTLPNNLAKEFVPNRKIKLIELIEKPIWSVTDNGESYSKTADGTLIPDIITITEVNGEFGFYIFDAKYYTIQFDKNKPLKGQPGIESITKQYLYQLAFQKFIEANGITKVCNCFLMPTEGDYIVDKGEVSLDMLNNLGLKRIQNRLLPACRIYDLYLSGEHLKFDELRL